MPPFASEGSPKSSSGAPLPFFGVAIWLAIRRMRKS